jgi:hypothetical protein
MNKIMKTLISVLFIVGLVLPTTMVAADCYAAVSDFTADGIDTDASVIAITYTTQNTNADDHVSYTVEVSGDMVDTVTFSRKIAEGTTSEDKTNVLIVPVSEVLEAGAYDLTVTVVGTDLDAGAKAHPVKVTVADADPVAPVELLEDELVSEIDLEEDELTFNDEILFEIDFEHSDASNDVEEAYFEVALYDGSEKLAGWVESKDDNIRFEDDDEMTFDQADLNAKLVVPSQEDIDMDGEDTKELQLVVRVFGDYEYNGVDYNQHLLDVYDTQTITVEKLENHLNIDTVSIEQQGNVLYTAITVENDGEENQKDVRARVQIVELDVKQTSNTVAVYEDDDATIYVPVVLPAFATGEYTVRVTVYNNDVSVTETVEDVELDGVMTPNTQPDGGVIIGVDTAVKTIPANGAVYAMTFTNNDAVARTFVLETAGAEWAQTSVNPTTVVVGAGASEIASIFVAPNANELGTRQFTVFIKEGAQIVKTIGLTANVEGNLVTGNAGFDFEDIVDSGLKWVAAILVVVLIVLFVMWSWNKAEEEEL